MLHFTTVILSRTIFNFPNSSNFSKTHLNSISETQKSPSIKPLTMARSRFSINTKPNSSSIFNLLSLTPFSSLVSSSKKRQKSRKLFLASPPLSVLFFSVIVIFAFSLILMLTFTINTVSQALNHPCSVFSSTSSSSNCSSRMFLSTISAIFSDEQENPRMIFSEMLPLPSHGIPLNSSKEEALFWKQPDNEGYEPCLSFTIGYRKESSVILKEKKRFLVVAASGGLNQQRNEIIDGVVIARILKAALVLPVLKVNFFWGDESEFSELFDVEHFMKTLQADLHIVSSLPFTHIISRQSIETQIPFDVSPLWIQTRFSKQLTEEGVLVLKGLDSKLSKNLPSDLQKLRCKVAFHALRFATPIRELGNILARRMWIEGPYIAIHLRLEKDVWVHTGCQTGLGPQYDEMIRQERSTRPEYLTGRLNMTYPQRRLAGLCPLNAFEISRLLKALGAPRNARVYVAGGEPLGGSKALKPLIQEFPNVVTKQTLARQGELDPFINRSSALAAIDYTVSLSSDVFLPSHGGNMGRVMQGHRAYSGHRKYIKPNKRMMLQLFEDESISEAEFKFFIKKMHKNSQGQPEPRTRKRDRDVIAYPVPECMCKPHA